MAKTHGEKSLTINRGMYEGVTTTPHFPIEISYFGHHVSFDDIYIDDSQQFIQQLHTLESRREGGASFDGGPRIKIWFRSDVNGGVLVSFRSEQNQPSFPGRCVLEGSFEIAGEHVRELVHSFEKLFRDGTPVSI